MNTDIIDQLDALGRAKYAESMMEFGYCYIEETNDSIVVIDAVTMDRILELKP